MMMTILVQNPMSTRLEVQSVVKFLPLINTGRFENSCNEVVEIGGKNVEDRIAHTNRRRSTD